MSFTKQIIIDGSFKVAREVEGGPMVTTDEVTGALSLSRTYCVLRDYYVPLSQGVPDVRFTNAYLVSETPQSTQGALYFFQRNFSQVPDPRTESRPICFARPGQSKVSYSAISGQAIKWDQYGKARPSVRVVNAKIDYTYVLSPNNSETPFGIPPEITQILYDGAPVDFAGSVYTFTGTAQVGNLGNIISEDRWSLAGFTIPDTIPFSWIQEVNISRYRGPIWQKEIVTVSTTV